MVKHRKEIDTQYTMICRSCYKSMIGWSMPGIMMEYVSHLIIEHWDQVEHMHNNPEDLQSAKEFAKEQGWV